MRVTEWPQHVLNCSVGRTERLGVAKWSPEVRFSRWTRRSPELSQRLVRWTGVRRSLELRLRTT